MSIIHLLSENIALPMGDFMERIHVKKFLDLLMKSQFWTTEQIKQYQNTRLKKLITHSYHYVPYYNDLFKSLGLKPEDIQTSDDLSKIPILEKSTIKKEGIDRFTSVKLAKKNLLLNSSSGSTGEPLFYYNTRDAYSINLAANIRGWYWMGYRLGDRYIKLSQNARKNPLKRLQDLMSRNLYIATNPLIESNFEHILNKIENYKPLIIRCYPDPLLFLAKYKNLNPKFKYSPKAITTTGNTLHPETRAEIEKAFSCQIFDSYSCEGNSIVFECPTHTCYHSTEEYGISEIVNKNHQRIANGIGTIISTDLWNFAHPFIRYNTQDLAEINDSLCICGRNLLTIKRILGRDNEILEMPNGQKFIVHNFTGFFQIDNPKLKRSIDQFQVIKHSNNTLTIRLVVNNKYDNSVAEFIRIFWEDQLKTKVVIEIVDLIPLTNSGKRRFIINE